MVLPALKALSISDRERLCQLYNNGLSYQRIADIEQCSASHVRKALCNLQIPLIEGRQRMPFWSAEQKDNARSRLSTVRKITINESLDDCIQKFVKRHGYKYDYSRVVYQGSQIAVNIVCHTHGLFEQKPTVHKNGSGCPQCGFEKLVGVYRKRRLDLLPNAKQTPATFYIVKLYNETEEFYKCGITINTVNSRLSGHCPYKWTVISTILTTLYDAFIREQHHLENITRYKPKLKFKGHTECFKLCE